MVDVEISAQVATITLKDCARLSEHSEQAGTDLRDALLQCGDRDDLKVIVLRSNGPDFCPAGDRDSARGAGIDQPGWNQIYATSTGLYQALCFSKKVTITAVQGTCALAGSLLVLCSDLTIAAPDAIFYSPFPYLPEANFVLAALTMRLGRAKAWMLDTHPMDTATALRAGLINRVATKDATSEALIMAQSIARSPLDGIAMSKLMVETCLDSQGVGQDFDMAGFYAASVPLQGTSPKLHRS